MDNFPNIFVHPHALKHGLSEEDIVYAWVNFVRSQKRTTPLDAQTVRIGYGKKTTSAIQMIGIEQEVGTLIIHAMAPPQNNILKELRM